MSDKIKPPINELSEDCMLYISRRAMSLIPGNSEESITKRKIFELGMVEALSNLESIKLAQLKTSIMPPITVQHPLYEKFKKVLNINSDMQYPEPNKYIVGCIEICIEYIK